MKKTKLTAILALALSALLLFSACGSAGTPVKNLLIPDQAYTDNDPSLTEITTIADLKGTTYVTQSNELYYFTTTAASGINVYEKHIVYNVKTNTVVLTLTESATTNIKLSLHTLYLHYGDDKGMSSYIEVTTTSWKLNEAEVKIGRDSVAVTLYNSNGTSFASANRSTDAIALVDLLYFDGKCYRLGEDDIFTHAFDYSPLAEIPDVSEKHGDYYYEFEDEYVKVYDATLQFVSAYYLPEYADVLSGGVLEDGNVFLQYVYQSADDSAEYTFITEDEIEFSFGGSNGTLEALVKYNLVTVLVNAKDGSAKTLECNYLIDYTLNAADMSEAYAARLALNTKKMPVIAYGQLIENKRLSSERLLILKKDGVPTEIADINGSKVISFSYVANNRWEIECDDRSYLINEKGEVLGDVTNARSFGNYLYADGKVYNYDLAVVFDYANAGLTLYSAMDNALILQNADSEYLLYTGGEAATTIISKTAKLMLADVQDNFYVLLNTEAPEDVKYDIYNDQGVKLLSIKLADYTDFGQIGYESYYELPELYSCVDQTLNRVYYRLH